MLAAAGLVLERGRVAAERPNEAVAAGVGKDQPPRYPTTHQPTQLQQALKQRRAQGAGEVRAPLGPVQAAPGEGSALAAKLGQVHPEVTDQLLAVFGEVIVAGSDRPQRRSQQRIGHGNPDGAGEVVVTGAREPQRLRLLGLAETAHRPLRGEHAERLNRLGHGRSGQAVVAMSTLSLDRQQATVEQAPQVSAGGGRADPGAAGQLSGGQGTSSSSASSITTRAGSASSAAMPLMSASTPQAYGIHSSPAVEPFVIYSGR
jgi:hypothetical protein